MADPFHDSDSDADASLHEALDLIENWKQCRVEGRLVPSAERILDSVHDDLKTALPWVQCELDGDPDYPKHAGRHRFRRSECEGAVTDGDPRAASPRREEG